MKKGYWNYRVVHKPGEGYFISEVYYDKDENPFHFTVEPILPFGETKKELRNDYAAMLLAFGCPVIEWEDMIKKVGLKKTEASPNTHVGSK